MNYLPIFLDITDRPCLVVGGGDVAARKASLLMRARGKVRVVAPKLCTSLAREANENRISHLCKTFDESDLKDCSLVVSATNDHIVNSKVAAVSQARGIPVNVVDDPELCSFIFPSIVDRSPVVIAVSSSGTSPVLARLLRTRLETLIPATYGRLASLVQGFRVQVKDRFKTSSERRRFWEGVLQGPVAELIFAGKEGAARAALDQAINSSEHCSYDQGEVYLVGAGPGDPDLLSFRALRLMQQADVVLYDRLVAKEILDLTRRDAERIYVGKKRSYHMMRQEEINDTLVALAKQGKRVLRLKGGDPFIFGRGGEEIDTLAAHGIPFQIVPGITAAAGCAAYAGIPLTHRDYAQSCVFVTGHLQDDTFELNWEVLTQPRQTVVCYMGLTGLEALCRELIAHGVSKQMPAALVEQGTTQRQRVFTGTLSTLPAIIQDADVHAPTLIIIGEVVRLHEKLSWFHPVSTAEDIAGASAQ